MQLLFLDFDGVLHPKHSDTSDHFCLLANFESVMREFPAVRIVIASTWRQAYSLNHIRRMFSQDIAARIIGLTPDWEESGDEYVRFREIREFLRSHSLTDAQWIAVDDSDFEFPEGCRNLLLCHSQCGLDADAAEALRDRLRSIAKTPK